MFIARPFRIFLGIILLSGLAFAYAPAPSVNDGFDPDIDGTVESIAVQPDGYLLISGFFIHINGSFQQLSARLKPDGRLDETFSVFGSPNARFVPLQDGKILAMEIFYGSEWKRLCRLNSDGSFDPSFPNPTYIVRSIVVQPDRKILVSRMDEEVDPFAYRLVRLNSDGTTDSTFVNNSNAYIWQYGLQSDGRIVIVGAERGSIDGVPFRGLARLNVDGSLDPTFNLGWAQLADAMIIQPDDKILIGGRFMKVDGVSRPYIARLNANGTVDYSFKPTYNGDITHLFLQPDGKILTVGKFTTVNGLPRKAMARLNPDGSLDQTFDIGSGANDGAVRNVTLQKDGTIIAVGDFTMFDGFVRPRIVKLGEYGTVDATFNSGGVGTDGAVNAITVQPDGKMVCGGAFTQVFSAPRGRLTRFNLDGTADLDFKIGSGMDAEVVSIAVQDDGKLLVGGAFTTVNGIARNHIARLKSDGSLDTSTLELGATGSVNAFARQADGKWVIGGDFGKVLGVYRNRIARLNADLTLDNTFYPGGGPNDSVKSIAIQPDGKLVVAGNFTQFNGNAQAHVVRLLSNGGVDATFAIGTGANGHIRSAIVQNDGKILLSGSFTMFNDSARSRIVRLLGNGSIDSSFVDSSANNSIIAMALQADGRILIGGDFTKIGATLRNHVARLNADGSHDDGFDPGSGANDRVSALALQIDGKLMLGGAFTAVRAYPRNHIARMSNPDLARQTLSVSPAGDSILWRVGGSYPQPSLVVFEESPDKTNWTTLGMGMPVPGVGYQIKNLSLPQKQNHYVRARAWTSCGYYNGSVSPVESVLLFNNMLPHTAASNWAMYE